LAPAKVLKHPLIFRCNLTILRSRSAWLFDQGVNHTQLA
jgi:hypothetical protein